MPSRHSAKPSLARVSLLDLRDGRGVPLDFGEGRDELLEIGTGQIEVLVEETDDAGGADLLADAATRAALIAVAAMDAVLAGRHIPERVAVEGAIGAGGGGETLGLQGLDDLGMGGARPEFNVKSTAYKVGAYTRSAMLSGIFVVAGIGLCYRRSWARKLGLVILVVSTVYGAYQFAWGVARGTPSSTLVVVGFAVVGAWNAIWFTLVYRRSSAQCLV